MMKQKSISKNYLYNLFYQILVIVMPLITTPYLSRVLGAEAIGIYSYTLSIATYFILFGTLGISLYGQREIAYVQEDDKKRSITFWEILFLKIITMTISIFIFWVTYGMYGQYKIYYRILVIELISQCIDISWFFQGIEEFKKTVIRNSIVKLIFAICIFMFVKSPNDLIKYIVIIAGANLFGNMSLWMYIPKYIQKVAIKDLHVFKHLKPTILLFIPQIAVQIYTVLDRTMLGIIIEDKSEVGFYEQAQKVVKLLLTLITSLGTVMVPRMASTFAKGDKEQLKKYMYSSFSFVFFLAFPIMAGLILISGEFVPIFFGQGYEKVAVLINVIVPITLFIGLSNIIGTQYLLPTKRQTEFSISVIVGAIVNFILNIIVIKKYASIGASITTVIAEFLVTAVQFYFVRKEIDIKTVLRLSKNNIIATVIMFVIVYITTKVLTLHGIYSIIIQITEGCIIYGIILILLKDSFVNDVLNKVNEKRNAIVQRFRR
ncbi:MAG TPA: flippase [Clostridiaceae bacterium]|nr:flippase [Clostridiaceae bacterium]